MKVCICYTVPSTLEFATATIKRLISEGAEVFVICSNESQLSKFATQFNIKYYVVPFDRGYNLVADIKALILLIKLFRFIKPDVVIGATPKAGLLSMLASFFVGVKKRIYHIFGFPFETAKGVARRLLISIERLSAMCATNVLPISQSIAKVCLTNKITKSEKLCLDYALTIGGVDMDRFNPDIVKSDILKRELNIDDRDFVIGFVGRITRDKGIYDYISVVKSLKYDNIKFLIIGDNDARSPVNTEIIEFIDNHKDVIHINFTDKIEYYYKLMNILMIPSYREGFGNANVEAQAMKVPVVCYSVTGCVDSVQNGISGFSVPFLDISSLLEAVETLINDEKLRTWMGVQAREFVQSNFTTEKIAKNNVEFILK